MTDTIGRFEIRRELGRGAQSAVYLAWDPQLQREVAIKTLHFGQPDPEQSAMLLDEARTASQFRHANVVPIFDLGEEGGDPYLVFEYVDGRSLHEQLRDEGPLPPVKAAGLMRQVADALAQAHAIGIIHRDLKPSNILLDRQGTPKVMDFGIASQVPESGRETGNFLMGTPAYMAPEYVTLRVVTQKMDVFAAGLVLLEMLTGKRYFQGGSVESLLYRISCEPVTLPKEAGIDERLGSIVLRACALDPAIRFPTAAELRQALDDYLGTGKTAETAGDAGQGALEFLLRRMRHKSDFPALSDSVSAINKLTNSDKESINKLSNTILKDYALTNKILRLVNSAFYRQAGGGNISTVSRAVIVLGFDVIRNIAITVLLFEHLQDKANVRELKEAFLRANLAGLLARDAGQRVLPREMEEVFICALFHNLGQLLAQYYFPEEVDEIRKLMQQRRFSEAAASAQVLGVSFEDLGIGVARKWGFPGPICNSMRRLPEGPVRKPAGHDETLRVLAGFANEFCDLMAAEGGDRQQTLATLSTRFGASLDTGERQLQAAAEKSFADLAQMASILRVNLKQSPFGRQVQAFTGAGKALAGEAEAGTRATGTAPVGGGRSGGSSGAGGESDSLAQTVIGASAVLGGAELMAEAEPSVPEDAQAVLAAGIQDISNSLVEDFSLNDLLRIILETMYRAMGFNRVLLCLKDAKTGQMAGRFGFGADTNELARRFRFPLSYTPDVFHLATGKAVDIIIADIDDPKISDRVPVWYRQLATAKTFVLFPLNIKGNPVALIYCDKEKAGSIAIPERELALLKTLRNQALLAIKQAA